MATKWMDDSVIRGMLTELLYLAVEHGTAAQVTWLLEMGADPEGKLTDYDFSPLYMTCLHRESDFERVEIGRLLIAAGADVNRLTATNSNVVIAARRGRTDMVRLLLENGADPVQTIEDFRDGVEPPLVYCALKVGHAETADVIREVLGKGR